MKRSIIIVVVFLTVFVLVSTTFAGLFDEAIRESNSHFYH